MHELQGDWVPKHPRPRGQQGQSPGDIRGVPWAESRERGILAVLKDPPSEVGEQDEEGLVSCALGLTAGDQNKSGLNKMEYCFSLT